MFTPASGSPVTFTPSFDMEETQVRPVSWRYNKKNIPKVCTAVCIQLESDASPASFSYKHAYIQYMYLRRTYVPPNTTQKVKVETINSSFVEVRKLPIWTPPEPAGNGNHLKGSNGMFGGPVNSGKDFYNMRIKDVPGSDPALSTLLGCLAGQAFSPMGIKDKIDSNYPFEDKHTSQWPKVALPMKVRARVQCTEPALFLSPSSLTVSMYLYTHTRTQLTAVDAQRAEGRSCRPLGLWQGRGCGRWHG